jgi:hypothetical protein
MSVNRSLPHVLVLPEDNANRQIANGFLLDSSLFTRKIQVLPEAHGWTKVLDCFKEDHIKPMYCFQKRLMVLLIDFDNRNDRLDRAKDAIPDDLRERVFILGALTNPEALKNAIGSYETIGQALAEDCREKTDSTWNHELLRHNASELARLFQYVRPILFSSL